MSDTIAFPARATGSHAPDATESWTTLAQIGEFASSQRHIIEPELSCFGLKFHITHATKGKNFRAADFLSYERHREHGFTEARALIERLLDQLDADAAPKQSEAQ